MCVYSTYVGTCTEGVTGETCMFDRGAGTDIGCPRR